jgi:hypothetical protein
MANRRAPVGDAAKAPVLGAWVLELPCGPMYLHHELAEIWRRPGQQFRASQLSSDADIV